MNLTKSSISSLLLVSVYVTFACGKSEHAVSSRITFLTPFTSSPLLSSHDARERVPQVHQVTTPATTRTAATALSTHVTSSNHEHIHASSSSSSLSSSSQRPRPHRVTRAATAKTERLWDYGVIPYEIESNFSGEHKALFKQAMRHWENFTCIKFIERTREHPNYITFTERPCGCCSFVGKRGNGGQAISIGKNCDKFGIVVHELGHVVGFWHEHTRPDRDNHVHVVHKNIMSGQEYNFNKLAEDEVNSLGLRYDFDSIMHYARNTFSKNAYLDTIEPNEDMSSRARPEIGQRLRLSKGDIAQTNLLYRCPSCGRTLQEPSGTLESPFYPHSSPPIDGESCEWRITATHGERIVLNVTDIDLPDSPACEKDYLEIRDGYWHKSPLLGKLCGNKQVPEAIISSGYRMLVTYKSTGTLLPKRPYRGFSASYEAQCGGEISNEEGTLSSPNFPDNYRPNKDCVWLLTVSENFHLLVKFQSFETENHESCVYDYLEVREGHSPSGSLIGKYCGFRPPPDLRSRGNKLSIRFVSDSSVQKAGFSASFSKEPDACVDCVEENQLSPEENNTVSVVDRDECAELNGGCQHICTNTLGSYQCSCHNGFVLHENGHTCVEGSCTFHITSPIGEMVSPNWPESYPAKKDCAWLFTTTPGHRIALSFVDFDLEPHQECAYDHIAIYDGLTHDSPTLGRFCGAKLPHLQISSINRMYMTFKSDASVQRKGFKAQHKSECGGRLIASNATAAHIYSHARFSDSDYGFKEDCEWIIEAPLDGQRLRLRFTSFQLEDEENCAYDYLEVYDGENDSADKMGRFCGSNTPPELFSTSEYLFIRFKTDETITSKGFAAAYQALDSPEDNQLLKRGLVIPNFPRMKSARNSIPHVNNHNQASQSGLQTSATNVQPQYQRQSTVNPASANSPVIYYDPRSRARHLGSHSQLQPLPQPNASANPQQLRLSSRHRSVPVSMGSTPRIKAVIRQNRPSRHQTHHRHHHSLQPHPPLHHHYHNNRQNHHHLPQQQLNHYQLNHHHPHPHRTS